MNDSQNFREFQGQPERMNDDHQKQVRDMCNQYHLYFVQLQMADGATHEGIIEDVDDEGVTVLLPEEENQMANLHYNGYGYGFAPGGPGFGPGYGPGYGPGFGPGFGPGYGVPRRFRRFRRRRFPFHSIYWLLFPFLF